MADLKTTAEERARLRKVFCVPSGHVPTLIDDLDTLLAENARLRAVAEAAREYRAMEAPGLTTCRDLARDDLDEALAALEAP